VEQPDQLEVPAGGEVMSENLRDNSNLDSSQNDSIQLFSGMAVIDGKNAQRPDRQSKQRGPKQFAQVRVTAGDKKYKEDEPESPAIIKDEVVFSNMVIDDTRRKNKGTENKYMILKSNRNKHGDTPRLHGKYEAV